jgi:hypothetical protein
MEDIGLAKMMHNIDKTKKRPLRNHEKIKPFTIVYNNYSPRYISALFRAPNNELIFLAEYCCGYG